MVAQLTEWQDHPWGQLCLTKEMSLPLFCSGAFWGSPLSGVLSTDHPQPSHQGPSSLPWPHWLLPIPSSAPQRYLLTLPHVPLTHLSTPGLEAGTLLCPPKVPD